MDDVIGLYLVQFLMKNSMVPVDRALKYLKHLSKGTIDTDIELKRLIVKINFQIAQQNFKIVIKTCELTNQDMVIWTNCQNDSLSRLHSGFSRIELEYFHTILQEIIGNDERKLKYVAVINITSSLTEKYSRESGQNVLNRWLKMGYLTKIEDWVCLGQRTMIEFVTYLQQHCLDSTCELCSELVIVAELCHSCGHPFHNHCLGKFFTRTNAQCPSCHVQWTMDEPLPTAELPISINPNDMMTNDIYEEDDNMSE